MLYREQNIFTRFSIKSEANASDFIEDLVKIFYVFNTGNSR